MFLGGQPRDISNPNDPFNWTQYHNANTMRSNMSTDHSDLTISPNQSKWWNVGDLLCQLFSMQWTSYSLNCLQVTTKPLHIGEGLLPFQNSWLLVENSTKCATKYSASKSELLQKDRVRANHHMTHWCRIVQVINALRLWANRSSGTSNAMGPSICHLRNPMILPWATHFMIRILLRCNYK